jgi:uncharacterized repeat protein (TIGR01451 family)
VTANAANLAKNATTLIIAGTNFSATAASNTVVLSSGTATVTTATATQLTCALGGTLSLGNLTAVVTSNGGSSGTAVQVATVVAAPTVTVNTANLAQGVTTLIITGTNFSTTAASNTIVLSSGTATVTTATATQLTCALGGPPSLGNLTANVTVFGGSSGATQVATIVGTPTVTSNTANLAVNATTLSIAGTNFSTTAASNTVVLSSGTATVTTATTTQLTCTLSGTLSLGSLTATVTVAGYTTSGVQVATVVAAPTVTANTANLALNATTLIIAGTNFSATAANNLVVLSSGTATVTASTATQLTCTLGGTLSLGTLTAVVTSNGGSSGTAVQVATVVPVPNLLVTTACNPTPAVAGSTATVNVSVTNSQAGSANANVSIAVVIPAGLTIGTVVNQSGFTAAVAGTTVTFANTTFNSTSAVVLAIPVTVAANQTANIPIAAPSVTFNPAVSGKTTTAPTGTTVQISVNADVAIANFVAAPPIVSPAGNIAYTFNVVNNGPSTATGVTLTDPLPAGAAYVSLTANAVVVSPSLTAGTLTYLIGGMTPGQSIAFVLTLNVPANATPDTYVNTVTASSTSTDNYLANNTGTATVGATPSLTSSAAFLLQSSPTMQFNGLRFSANGANDTVTFTTLGATGTVTTASNVQLTVAFTTQPAVGNLMAMVTTTNGNTSTVQVATVVTLPVITSAANTSFIVGTKGTFTVTTSGFPAPALTYTGTLPNGVTFTDNGNGTATLTGNPTNFGLFPIAITAGNGTGPNATQNFVLDVFPLYAFTPLVSPQVAVATNQTVTASGATGPYTYALVGALPAGLTLSPAGVVSGNRRRTVHVRHPGHRLHPGGQRRAVRLHAALHADGPAAADRRRTEHSAADQYQSAVLAAVERRRRHRAVHLVDH